jgi:hypothetical protein
MNGRPVALAAPLRHVRRTRNVLSGVLVEAEQWRAGLLSRGWRDVEEDTCRS